MRQGRFVWILGISLFCLMSIIVLKTPQKVVSALVDPHYGDSPRATIQQFWNLMDLRQTNLARELLSLPKGSLDENDFFSWENRLNKDPMLSLQKVEFLNLDSESSQPTVIRLSWTSPVQGAELVTYSMNVVQTEKGWRIHRFRRINNL